MLPASKALDTNVFAVTKATATKDHLTTISSLKPYASKLTLGGPPECPTFAGCEPGLKKVYGLNFAGFKSLDEAGPLSVAALKNGEVQVVELFSSDGNVVSNNFVALTDNKHLEGADYIVPVIRKSVDTVRRGEAPQRHRRQADHQRDLEAEPRRHRAAGAAGRGGPGLGEVGPRLNASPEARTELPRRSRSGARPVFRASGSDAAGPSPSRLSLLVGPSGRLGLRAGGGTAMAGASVPPSISNTLPVTQDEASETR